jgi:transketolase
MAIADQWIRLFAFCRPSVANLHQKTENCTGKGLCLTKVQMLQLLQTGHLVWEALIAKKLEERGILPKSSIFTIIKPLDEEAILNSVAKKQVVLCRRT